MRLATTRDALIVVNACLLAAFAGSFVADPFKVFHRAAPHPNETPALSDSQTAAAMKPFSHYETAIAGKSVFRAAIAEEPAALQRSAIADYRFIGASRAPSGLRAFIQNVITNETRAVSPGDFIGDYKVEEIKSNGILLNKGGEIAELKR
jgi:hypothetical protein